MTSSPLITIGITTYNAQDTVKRSLDSVLALDWSPLEILVLDDCSTDSTIEIIKSYVSDGYPIRILQNDQNRGLAYNRNRLCEEAKGEFFALHDDDDFCYPDRIKAQYDRIRAFEEETGIDKVFCFGDRLCINENGAQTIQLGVGRTGPAPHGLIFLKALLARRRPSKYVWGKSGGGTMMARTEVLKKHPFDDRFRRASEVDMFVRAAADNYHFISVPQNVIDQYITGGTNKTPSRKLYYQWLVLSKNYKRLREVGFTYADILRYMAYMMRSFVDGLKMM